MWRDSEIEDVAGALADAFLGGDWHGEGLAARAAVAFGRRPRWLRDVVRVAVTAYRDRPADRRRELTALLAVELRSLRRAGRLTRRPPPIHHRLHANLSMGRMRWPVPPIATVAELAAFLDLHVGELRWLADTGSLERTADDERLRNYRYARVERAAGSPRLIERPKRLLKETQRRILHDILDVIPPHDAAHGFRRGHSAVTHARRHVGADVVLRFDLQDFFASIDVGRVYGVFRGAGYPEAVAFHLAGLCTNAAPHDVLRAIDRPLAKRLAGPHLPQGAPTSPAVANLCAFALDRRLAALAASVGGVYTRYADDLAVSGGRWLLARASPVRETVARIVGSEGFAVNDRKFRLMTQAGRQQLTGVVVNVRPNVPRRDYDRLKATLHNAARRGPAGLDRAQLLGRIAWVAQLHPERGARLRALWDRIAWD